jgi:hypothetical protein
VVSLGAPSPRSWAAVGLGVLLGLDLGAEQPCCWWGGASWGFCTESGCGRVQRERWGEGGGFRCSC